MRLNRIIITLVLVLASCACAFAQDTSQSLGFQVPATQTVSVVSSYATILGTIPTACSRVEVVASGAIINYGPSTVNSGTMWPSIADGSTKTFENLVTRNPKIYFCIRGTATAAAKIGIAPH